MNLNLEYKFTEIGVDKKQTPLWADKIKRWSQLDEASFALAEATSRNLEFLSQDFDQLIIVSTQGSASTDYLFTTDSKISPSNFVHTLPNVRSVVFSILTGWEGQMFCLSQGHHSLVSFLVEAPFVHAEMKTVVVSLNKVNELYHCDFYLIGKENKNTMCTFMSSGTDEEDCEYLVDDFSFRNQLTVKKEIFITRNLGIRNTN